MHRTPLISVSWLFRRYGPNKSAGAAGVDAILVVPETGAGQWMILAYDLEAVLL